MSVVNDVATAFDLIDLRAFFSEKNNCSKLFFYAQINVVEIINKLDDLNEQEPDQSNRITCLVLEFPSENALKESVLCASTKFLHRPPFSGRPLSQVEMQNLFGNVYPEACEDEYKKSRYSFVIGCFIENRPEAFHAFSCITIDRSVRSIPNIETHLDSCHYEVWDVPSNSGLEMTKVFQK